MRLALLDTNVIVSAGIKRDGAPGPLITNWVLDGLVQAVTCPSVIAEYLEVARRSKFLAYGFPPPWLELLIHQSLHLPEPEPWPHSIPDPKDAVLLALAHASGAWLVTGNLKHYPEKARAGVTAVSPADYLARLLTGGKEPAAVR
jgi:putative PIN family toxin of toxin-antitoxin system